MTDNFPCDSFKDAATHLRRPFTPGAVKFKVQSTSSTRGMVVGYIDARLVVERLNLVVPHLWHDEYERLSEKVLLCKLTVDGITRQDVGEAAKIGKDIYSDALKRAAVKFGVGVSLYAMAQVWLPFGEGDGKLKKTDKTVTIPGGTDTYLRGLYEGWLGLERGGKVFGEPLDHGDDPEGSVGELADVEAEQPSGEEEAVMDEQRAKEQVEEIERLFAASNGNGRKITKGSMNAMISGAKSNDELQAIIDDLAEKVG